MSGATDLADGYIARRFHMVSDLGKMLDPVADKLTQGAILICLVTRFPRMWLPLILLAVKEAFVGITSLLVIRKSGAVAGGRLAWQGGHGIALPHEADPYHLARDSGRGLRFDDCSMPAHDAGLIGIVRLA